MPKTEPIFYTSPSRFLDATEFDQKEKHFMVSLCAYLGLKIEDRDDVDEMKEAVLGFVSNQAEGWMKINDSDKLNKVVKSAFKRLCEAQGFLTEREGVNQIFWQQVLENHVKLIAAYSHILTIC